MKRNWMVWALPLVALSCGDGGIPAGERLETHATAVRAETRQHAAAISAESLLSLMMPEEDRHQEVLRAHIETMNDAIADLGVCYGAGQMQAGMKWLDLECETHHDSMAVAIGVDEAHAEETRHQQAMDSAIDSLLLMLRDMEEYGCHEERDR